MPGHSLAALAAYPNMGCTGGPYEVATTWGVKPDVYCVGNEEVFVFLQDVILEVMELFPSKYIHIGGDECYKGFWEKCPKCQLRIHDEGLHNTKELQSYFIKRVEKILETKNKRLVGWDEILEGGLAPNATVMSWRGMRGGIEAAKQGHHVIMTPTNHCYLDLYQGEPSVEPDTYSMCRLSDSYSFEPVPEGVDWEMWLGPAPKVPYRGIMHWDWRWIMDYSGGQLTDWAGHHIDIAQWGLGFERTGPVKIKAEGERRKNDIFNVPYKYEIDCEYENGVEMKIANKSEFLKRKGKGWDERDKKKTNIGMGAVWFGEEGWIHVNRSGLWASDPKFLEVKFTDNDIRLYRSRNHHQNFIECVRSRKETVAPAEIGHRSISVALLGEIAMAVDKKLNWNPETEKFTNNNEANELLLRPYRQPWKMPKI